METYQYSITNDCLNGMLNSDKLKIAIEDSEIEVEIIEISTSGDDLFISFEGLLSSGEESLLDILVATTDSSPFISYDYKVLGSRQGLNLNSTQDQAIVIPSSWYIIRKILCCKPSGEILNAIGGIYSEANKGGTEIVPVTQEYAFSGPTKFKDLELHSDCLDTVFNDKLLYFSLTTPEGSEATVDILVYGEDLTAQ